MNAATPSPLAGGCLCGRVRYAIARPGDAYWCHCTMCRRNSGSAAVPWVSVERADFQVTAGALARYTSSHGVTRGFCGHCGGVLLFDMACEAAVDVAMGTLDDPDALTPTHHIWTQSALAMAQGLGANLPRHGAEKPSEGDD